MVKAQISNILTINSPLLILPPVFMLISQLVSVLGTVYFMHFCNDMCLYSASKQFGEWTLTAALVAQYIQFFYYSGRGRGYAAGIGRPSMKDGWNACKLTEAGRFRWISEVGHDWKDSVLYNNSRLLLQHSTPKPKVNYRRKYLRLPLPRSERGLRGHYSNSCGLLSLIETPLIVLAAN